MYIKLSANTSVSERSDFDPMSGHVTFMVDKADWGSFSSITSVSLANFLSTNCSVFINQTYHGCT
jgi:hypothetical protein